MSAVARVAEEQTNRGMESAYAPAPVQGGAPALAAVGELVVQRAMTPKVAACFNTRASEASIAQHKRWQGMAGEIRAASRGTRESVLSSVALLDRRTRQLNNASAAVEEEMRQVAEKGREAQTSADHFFSALLAQVESKRAEVLMALKEEQSAKEWALLQQQQRLLGAKANCEDAAKEGKRLCEITNELELLESVAPIQAFIDEAIANDVFDDPTNMRPAADARYTSEVGVGSSAHGTKAVPEFLVPTYAQWCRPPPGSVRVGSEGSRGSGPAFDPFMGYSGADPDTSFDAD